MASPVLPANKSTADLLKQLKATKDDPTTPLKPARGLDEIVEFLVFFGFDQGDKRVRKATMYKLYKLWSKDPVDNYRFNFTVGQFLLSTNSSGTYYYLVNQSTFKIHEKTLGYLEEKRDKTKSKRCKRHFDNYLDKYELKRGTYWLESFILYYLYDLFCYSNGYKANPLGENNFINFCKLQFETKRRASSRMTWFGVDPCVLKYLPEEHLKQLREGRAWRHGRLKDPKYYS